MTKCSVSEIVESVLSAQQALLENTIARLPDRDDPKGVRAFVESSCLQTEEFDGSRVGYYGAIFDELVKLHPQVESFPPTEFISTINNNSLMVDIGKGPVLVIDVNQGKTLDQMSRIFLASDSATEPGAVALRLYAEQCIVHGNKELAGHVAVCYSELVNLSQIRGVAVGEDEDEDDIEDQAYFIGHVQDAFIVAHEVGHFLWSKGDTPGGFETEATRWIAMDGLDMQATASQASSPWPPSRAAGTQDSPYSPQQLQRTLERRCNPTGEFLEEVWADHYACITCMQLYSGVWPAADVVYPAISLAMRNIATVDAIRRLAKGGAATAPNLDDASSRRNILRYGFRTLLGDLRENDDYRRAMHLCESDLDSDFAAISTDIDQRYFEEFWNPIMAAIGAATLSAPSEQDLSLVHMKLEREFGPDAPRKVLKDCPINDKSQYYADASA